MEVRGNSKTKKGEKKEDLGGAWENIDRREMVEMEEE